MPTTIFDLDHSGPAQAMASMLIHFCFWCRGAFSSRDAALLAPLELPAVGSMPFGPTARVLMPGWHYSRGRPRGSNPRRPAALRGYGRPPPAPALLPAPGDGSVASSHRAYRCIRSVNRVSLFLLLHFDPHFAQEASEGLLSHRRSHY